MQLGKIFFISFQNLFLFLRKSNFRILHIQISWRYQMPKHKTRNNFYWITWEVNSVCQWNLASLCHMTKEKKITKTFANTATWKLVPDSFVLAKNKHKIYWKMNFWSELFILDMLSQNYQNMSKSACIPPQISF